MIQFAADNDIEQIKRLWVQAFDDSVESAAYFLTHCSRPDNILIDKEDGNVCAMLTMLPLMLCFGGETVPARYIYAVATDTAYRGQGRSTRLLAHAHTYMKQNGVAASLLVPASESLFTFYAQRGYKRAFSLSETTYESASLPTDDLNVSVELCTPEQYARIRKKAFAQNRPFAAWKDDMLSRVMAYARLFGGEFYHICTKEGEAAALCIKEGDVAVVKELACVGIGEAEAVTALHTRLGAARYRIRSEAGNKKSRFDFAMLYDLGTDRLPEFNNAYFNLAMD